MPGNQSRALLRCFLLSPLVGALLASSSQLPSQEAAAEAEGQAELQKPYGLSSAACRVAHRCNATAADNAAFANEVASHPIWLKQYLTRALRGCSCKNGCELFDTCCADIIHIDADRVQLKRMPRHSYSCSASLGAATGDECDPLGSGLTVVHRCPMGSDEHLKPASLNASLSAMCDFPMNASSMRTDELVTPVTDRGTGVTYRNVHCATCWSIPQRELVSWEWKLRCNKNPRGRRLTRNLPRDNQSDASAMAEQLWLRQFALFVSDSCTTVLRSPPSLLSLLHRCQPELYEDCQHDNGSAMSDSIAVVDARACAQGPTAIVYSRPLNDGQSVAYRNADCARCRAPAADASNAVNPELTCVPRVTWYCSWPRVEMRTSYSDSLTALLSSGSDSDVVDDMCPMKPLWRPTYGKSPTVREQCAHIVRCALGDIKAVETPDDPILCSFLCQTPGERYIPAERRCRPAINATRSCRYYSRWPDAGSAVAGTLPPAKAVAHRARLEIDHDGGSSTMVVPINDTLSVCFLCTQRISFVAYELLNDGVLRANGSSYAPPLYVVDTKLGVATVCVPSDWHDLIFGVLPASVNGGDCDALPGWVTTVILATSVACLLLYLALFASWRRLRHFPGDLVANEACAFLVGFTLFLLRPLAADSAIACHVIAVGIHYFLVAAFVWMMLYAIEIVRALSFSIVQLTDSASDSSRRRHIAYYAIGWLAPLTVVGSALLADGLGAPLRPAYGSPQCFLNSLRGNRAFFVAPLCAATVVVVCVYGYMTTRLIVIARQTRVARRRGADAEKLMLAVKLLFALGPLWLFAVLSSFIDSPPIACTFVVLNASQGIFLLATYACNTEARRQALNCWSRHFRSCRRGRRRLQMRSTSSASRSDGEPVSLSVTHGEGTMTQISIVNVNN